MSPYGVAKLAVERYLYYYHHEYGLDVTCLRYANVYGQRQNPFGEAGVSPSSCTGCWPERRRRSTATACRPATTSMCPTWWPANLAALGREGFRTYNVGTGRETSVVELYDHLTAALGVDRPVQHGPGKPGEQRRSVIDPSKIQAELDLGSPRELAAGLGDTARWFRARNEAG